MDQLSTAFKGQEALTTFPYTLIHYHSKIFPGLNLLCTTEAAEASFLPVANFLMKLRGLGCMNYTAMFGSSATQPDLQVMQGYNPYWHLGMNTVNWQSTSLWGRWGAAGTRWSLWDPLQEDETPSSVWPECALAFLLAADSLVPPQPVLTCLPEVASPCGDAPLAFIWCHLGSPQF